MLDFVVEKQPCIGALLVFGLAFPELQVRRYCRNDGSQNRNRRSARDDVLFNAWVPLAQKLKRTGKGAEHDHGQAEASGKFLVRVVRAPVQSFASLRFVTVLLEETLNAFVPAHL